MQPPEGPPVCAALNRFPFGIPPAMSKMISPSVVPIGTSTIPVFTTSPASAKTFVPVLFGVPVVAKAAPPIRMTIGTFARVSTLLMMVGRSKTPRSNGNGGFWRGSPRFPSIEAISAVSSPQTNAPAPIRISMSNENGVPMTRSPRSPDSRACRSAAASRSTASGYSART